MVRAADLCALRQQDPYGPAQTQTAGHFSEDAYADTTRDAAEWNREKNQLPRGSTTRRVRAHRARSLFGGVSCEDGAVDCKAPFDHPQSTERALAARILGKGRFFLNSAPTKIMTWFLISKWQGQSGLPQLRLQPTTNRD